MVGGGGWGDRDRYRAALKTSLRLSAGDDGLGDLDWRAGVGDTAKRGGMQLLAEAYKLETVHYQQV